jgi:hypothetical protein
MTIERKPDPDEELLKIKATNSLSALVIYQADQTLKRMLKLTEDANNIVRRALKLTEEKTKPK